MEKLEVVPTSVCWETATKLVPAAVALGSALAVMESPARVSIKTQMDVRQINVTGEEVFT